jgi:cation diffusion facilitator CzcD-associated flavoprotein CzcO
VKHFDAIIIGTGQAGPSLAARFSDAGMTVAIIERHKFGGTCVNRLHPDKDDGCQRLRDPYCSPRR